MGNLTLVRKASGEQEPFSRKKLESSLERAGADKIAIYDIVSEVEPWLYKGISTRKIYKKAFKLLRGRGKGMAARYSLKKAIMELGPTGYPFEHFMGELLRPLGIKSEVGQLLQGKCVKHEVDVVVTGKDRQYFVECKYYNSQGKYADVKVPLYIRSRFEDIVEMRKNLPEYAGFTFHGWLVTNTRFTSDAMDYGKCAGLHLMSWDYPKGHSLKDLIEQNRLFPITVITLLTNDQKKILLNSGIVLCSQIKADIRVLEILNLSENKRKKIMLELEELLK